MTRNPFMVGLIVVGSLLALTSGGLWFALSELLAAEPSGGVGAIGVALTLAAVVLATVATFVGAAVIAGIEWANRRARGVEDAELSNVPVSRSA